MACNWRCTTGSALREITVFTANSKPDYRAGLQEELMEMHESELWRTGAQVRKLRPHK